MAVTDSRPKIGISACLFHADPARAIFKGKTLQYVEQSVPHWIMSAGAMPVMIPSPEGDTKRGDVTLEHYADWLDGLVLEGGSDVWPGSYGQAPLRPEWTGDAVRDAYEMALLRVFVRADKPVFGICRGLQLINVAYGGTLFQDLTTQRESSLVHRDPVAYDRLTHRVELILGSRLASLYPGQTEGRVNSVHHQAIEELGRGLVVEARSPDDGVIEAVRLDGDAFVAAVQWHPEFARKGDGTLDGDVLLEDFVARARLRSVHGT